MSNKNTQIFGGAEDIKFQGKPRFFNQNKAAQVPNADQTKTTATAPSTTAQPFVPNSNA